MSTQIEISGCTSKMLQALRDGYKSLHTAVEAVYEFNGINGENFPDDKTVTEACDALYKAYDVYQDQLWKTASEMMRENLLDYIVDDTPCHRI